MAMNRTEQIGLGSAVGGHAFLLLLLSLGVFGAGERLLRPQPIEVSLVGETAPEATSPTPSSEAPAPAAIAEPEPAAATEAAAPEAPSAPPELVIAKPIARPAVRPIEKPRPSAITDPVRKPAAVVARKPAAKPAPAKPAPTKATAAKPNAAKPRPASVSPASKPAKATARSGGFGKGFEDRIAGIGKSSSSGTARPNAANGQGKSPTAAAPPGKPAAEVRRSVNASLAAQIKPYLEACAPSGVDMDAIRTFITLSLDRSGGLSSVRFDKQTGVNASNSPQADPLKQCALRAARQASPYRGLDPEYYDVWKTHALQLKAK
jgi:periplasmic protein TonB